jgi:hypothetical protein
MSRRYCTTLQYASQELTKITVMLSSGHPTLRTPLFLVQGARSCSSHALTATLAPARTHDSAPHPRRSLPSALPNPLPLRPFSSVGASSRESCTRLPRPSLAWGFARHGHCTRPPAASPHSAPTESPSLVLDN